MKKIILSLFFAILLCGCTGYKETNNGYLVTSVAISKSGDGVTILLNTLSSKDQESIILSSEGYDLKSAFKNLKKQQTKSLYFEHCGVVALTTNLKNDVKPILNFCKNTIKVPIAVQIVYCDDANALFAADRTGYDVISLIKNADNKTDNLLYKIEQKTKFKLPIIIVRDDVMFFEDEG